MTNAKEDLIWLAIGLPAALIVSVILWFATNNPLAVIAGFLLSEILILFCMALCESAKRGETLSEKTVGKDSNENDCDL